jgi:hypothetical protein
MGIVDPHALSEAMAAGRWGASMSSVAQVIDPGAILSAQEDGEKLLRAMADRPTSPHVLVEAGQVVAVVWPADVIQAMEGA